MPDFISHMRKPVAPATSARHQTTGVKHQRGGSAAPAAELVLEAVADASAAAAAGAGASAGAFAGASAGAGAGAAGAGASAGAFLQGRHGPSTTPLSSSRLASQLKSITAGALFRPPPLPANGAAGIHKSTGRRGDARVRSVSGHAHRV